ncbi:MMPL family transporter [Rhodospirillaceae bacterium AH-315-P19]|nr:MMPL family transporter [Rhodospirillaceae bacterium AH-315-P19]
MFAKLGITVESYTRWVLRWRFVILPLTLVVALGLASGVQHLGFSTDYRVFFSEENPQLLAFEELQDVYTKDDNILFVLKPAKGDVFTKAALTAIKTFTDEGWKIPFATRVDSLTNFQHSYAEGDDLTVEDLVRDPASLTRSDLARIRDVAFEEPLILNRLLSPNGETTGININLTLPQKNTEEVPKAMAAAHALADRVRAEHPDIKIAVTGLVALNNAFTEASVSDLTRLVPLMYGVLLLVMFVLLRSVSGTFATLLVIGLSASTAMGVAGWMGVQLTPPSVSAPTIILTLAIADSVHVLVTMSQHMARGASKRDAILESMRINFHPIFLTSLTTAIGFLSLNFSDAPPFRDLGNITAFGVIAAWVYSVLFLPALMSVLPMRARPRDLSAVTYMERLANFVIAKRRALLWGVSAMVILLGIMIPRIELNDQFVNYFDPIIQFRADTDFAMENLSGIYQVQYSLPAGESGGISEPVYLQEMDAFANWLRARPEVVHVQTYTDIVRRLNKNMHGDDPAWYLLPDIRELAAQYLLLFEMSLPYGLDLNNQINIDKSSVRVIATLKNITTRESRVLKADSEVWLQKNMVSAAEIEGSGPFVMFAYISERNIKSMLVGTSLAFVLISLSLILALRHVRLGLLSLIPNLVPAVIVFGVWAIVVGELGLAASIVVATSLGIIVDDTVHFLSKYLRARREQGLNSEDAVRYAFATVGTALVVTSVILVAGFGVLAFSAFELNQSLGLLTAASIAAALFVDFTLLPALLVALSRGRTNAKETDHG